MARTKTTVPRTDRDRRLYKFIGTMTKKLYKNNKRNRLQERVGQRISRKILTRVYGEQVGAGWFKRWLQKLARKGKKKRAEKKAEAAPYFRTTYKKRGPLPPWLKNKSSSGATSTGKSS